MRAIFSRRFVESFLGALFALASLASVQAQTKSTDETGEQAASASQSAAATQETPPEPVKLDAVFHSGEAIEISVDAQEWTNLEVIEVVPHGTKVQAGDVLIRFESDKLQQAIEDLQHEIAADKLNLADNAVKLELARRSQDLALKAAASADRLATEDLKDFVSTGRQRQIDDFDKSVINARNRLEYQAEELKQLEAMYAADDLTEETEEIILKRTRDAVESAKYGLELALDSQRKGLEFELPRTEQQLEDAVARAALSLEEARRTAPQSLDRQQLQLDKMRQDLARKETRLERLRADTKRLVVTAPQSGMVYYGVPRDGKWAERSSVDAMLQQGGNPKPRTGLMTLAQSRPLVLRTIVPEASFRHLAPGTEVVIEPTAFADQKLKGHVAERSSVPVADAQFSATITLDDVELSGEIVPGMKAQVILETAPQ